MSTWQESKDEVPIKGQDQKTDPPPPTPHALLSVCPSTWHQRLGHPGKERSLYGLKQAPRAWFQRFTGYALRVGFTSCRCDSSLFIYQHGTEKYDMELLENAHMLNCNATRTPVDTESKLGSDGDPDSYSALYRSLTGGLQYLTFTRPDISYVTLSYSSAEAEYSGVANVVAETAWIRNLLQELHNPLFTATLVYCNNVLPTALFEEFRTSLSVRSSLAQTEEEY
nr:ribonuclease H-like domain-containing protein [Tanacetum cinerariifolium]